jgi:tetratricopeptide (TPR) repeat protein
MDLGVSTVGTRLFWRGLLVGALGGALLAAGAITVLEPKREALWVSATSTVDGVTGRIAMFRERIDRVPEDWLAWAELGVGYVEWGRATGNPGWYASAEGALTRSLAVHPDGNALATAGLGLLAAARNDFAKALGYGRAAAALGPAGSLDASRPRPAQFVDRLSKLAATVVADSLLGLGRYDDAWLAIQDLVDRYPDTDSYARAAYGWQLRGDMTRAKGQLERALSAARGPLDAALASERLTQLAWQTGDLDAAWRYMSEGLGKAPDSVPLQALRARLGAARGQVGAALADWDRVVAAQPLHWYAGEYGDLLSSTGDSAGSRRQWDIAQATAKLFAAQGVDMTAEMALMEAERGSAGLGVAMAREAFGKRPNVFVADTLAWCLYLAGKASEALRYADRALALGTRDATVLFHRAMIRLAVADRAGARADLRAALALNPTFSTRWAPVAHTTLATL